MANLVNVYFPIIGKELKISDDAKIADACAMVGEPLNQVCGGKGKCGKCAVEIIEGGEEKTVLGCMTKVSDGLQIMITGKESSAQILTTNVLKDVKPNPSLKSYILTRDQLKTPLGESDFKTLKEAIGVELEQPSLDMLQKLSNIFHEGNGIEVIVYKSKLIDVLPYESEKPIYGLAFDLGTTSVVGYLFDLKTFEQIGMSSKLNKQISIGGDVISRIDYASNEKNGIKRLNNLIVETINEIIDDICKDANVDKNRIYHANFCGNSTMQHLFLGLNPAYLGEIPFSSTIQESVATTARSLKININGNGMITVLPILGGHVGGDTAAVLLSLNNDGKKRLVIDLGTNGEVCVGNIKEYKASSMASGPALEGYGLENGMRGTEGAIERVTITGGDLYYKVIGDVKPQGICGSGIVDLISELMRVNVINESGALVDSSDVELPNLSNRLIKTDKGKAFVVANGEETESGKPILLTQKDIRRIQLAKAAIYTGCTMLIEECGIKGEDLDEILMAGAFGNYINIDKAQYMGLIPYYEGVPVYSIGNAAATGSQLFLLSENQQEECKIIASRTQHVEIATNSSFNDNYIDNLNLRKVEIAAYSV